MRATESRAPHPPFNGRQISNDRVWIHNFEKSFFFSLTSLVIKSFLDLTQPRRSDA